LVDVIDYVGGNAGKLWNALNSEGPLVEGKLMKKTGLKSNDFYTAVGWLARENKIRKDDATYMLGETNLTDSIGRDAGKVWRVLDTWGEVDLTSISRLARIDEKDVFSAIGWLAREGKISGREIGGRYKKIKFRLNDD
jgi:hypothetical protein